MGRRPGSSKPMWITIHKCMEATLGISLYSYLYPKLAKTLCLSYYLSSFLFKKKKKKKKEIHSMRVKTNDTFYSLGLHLMSPVKIISILIQRLQFCTFIKNSVFLTCIRSEAMFYIFCIFIIPLSLWC
jgi:hypothetical protein